jgi:hypothetical protein
MRNWKDFSDASRPEGGAGMELTELQIKKMGKGRGQQESNLKPRSKQGTAAHQRPQQTIDILYSILNLFRSIQ